MAKSKISTQDFYNRVYEIVSKIPEGKVTTYGAISAYLGVESGARMVGYALNNYLAKDLGYHIPAHRVVNRLGQLTGRAYFEGDSMRERLEQEGIVFKSPYTVDIDLHFWDPLSNS
ncbi:MGMT family protein [Balneola vulgaris]|jgi:methylated-DNA-protein-cysteine methyltransferase-like protein|uniref:MGMT family protein n=1 Tax=Balneola vulgaris TaxID=287535 RepID=UPI00035C65BD|nr:MGMT family protein [Balneola vulgaris]